MLNKIVKRASPVVSLRYFAAAVALLSVLFIGAATAGGAQTSKSFDDLEWIEGGPGLYFALSWGDWADGGDYGMIVKIEAGVELPRHSHTADYHGMTIQGNWVHSYAKGDERMLPPGSYIHQAGEEFHGDRCEGPEDCLILIHQHGARDFFLEE